MRAGFCFYVRCPLFLFHKGEGCMNLTLKEQLRQWKRKNQGVKGRKNKQPEKLSEGDLRYLMGMNMQTLRRGKGGAFKR